MDVINAFGELVEIIFNTGFLASPLIFAILTGTAVVFVWVAIAPSGSAASQEGRLEGYLQGRDIMEDEELQRSFWKRVVAPTFKKAFDALSSLSPVRDVERLERLLVHAGSPGNLTAPDVLGIQIIVALAVPGIYLLAIRLLDRWDGTPTLALVRNGLILAFLGYILPRMWLRNLASKRKREILRNFSDALDLLSVSVDAGLAFDSALVRVTERWDNALTEEFHRVVVEMRVGTPRNLALHRMARRTGVQDVETFVGVLIQSSELGVSIAQTLHTQAAQVRLRRRQRAEELARQASVKMVFALVFFVFPALLVVLLGPGIPRIFEALGTSLGS
jgi:tight adherence protein C